MRKLTCCVYSAVPASGSVAVDEHGVARRARNLGGGTAIRRFDEKLLRVSFFHRERLDVHHDARLLQGGTQRSEEGAREVFDEKRRLEILVTRGVGNGVREVRQIFLREVFLNHGLPAVYGRQGRPISIPIGIRRF